MDRDLDRLGAYLRNRYYEHLNAGSWLPERLHDLIYRVGAQEADDGRTRSADYIFLWEEQEEIVACILPDGENIYVSVKEGYEQLFPSMIRFSEKNCRPLFAAGEDASVKLWFAVSDRFPYMHSVLSEMGYREYPEKEYMTCVCPQIADVSVELPEGFRLLYGESYPDEANKWSALRLGFHPEYEAENYSASMNPYNSRKKSSLYADSFECIVTDENSAEKNKVCAYCFVYVDRRTKTAMIEPVSTREKYRHKGIGRALMHAAILRCKQLGVEKCFVDAFGERKDFYLSAGFSTEDSISFWYKTLGGASV
jgi:predicted GNAT family N-acyltransferase